MESSPSALPIELQQLEQFNETANRLLTSVRWTPKEQGWSGRAETSVTTWRESAIGDQPAEELSLLKIVRKFQPLALLLPHDTNYVLTAVWEALRIGMFMSKTYTRFSGLDQLIALNNRGGLAEEQKTEFRGKYMTASAVTLFATAYYAVWKLSNYRSGDIAGIKLEIGAIPEITLQNPVRAIDCLIFYYTGFVEKSGQVNSELALIKFTIDYFQLLLNEIKLREESLHYAQTFTGQIYKLEQSDFCLKGFEIELAGGEPSLEFNRVELGEIVGNRDAKHEVRRLAERLLCYDLQAKRNPFFELGGLAPISLGYGEPGTGKSMLIAALATLLDDYCKELRIPFLFWPMPDTVVSTYQGGSAERMMSWMRPLREPGKIVYAPIDDAENNFEDRTRQGVSAGVREVIAVFLRNTEGAYAINRGNVLIQLFTNLPEQIDKAVLSRINNRMHIGGATTFEDFLDQDYLWQRKHRSLAPDFVSMRDPENYSYLSAQAPAASFGETCAGAQEPKHERLRLVLSAVRKRYQHSEQAFFAELFKEVKRYFPLFTSRDVRNIQRAVDSRIMDVDLPSEWFATPELFFRKDYDTKRAMLVELIRGNMRGLSLADIRLQEALRYLDNMLVIAEAGRERRIQELANELEMRCEAEKLAARALAQTTAERG